MRRLLALSFALLLCGVCVLARAQDTIIGGGVTGMYKHSGGYSGPGDISSGAYAWWGLRCYNTAYTGNVADIWDSSTGSTTETLLTCSTGGTINQTINTLATTCASGCRVKTITDQSGNTHCTTACNATQATNANRPTFITSGCTGLSGGAHTWCMVTTYSGTTPQKLVSPAITSTISQIFTVYCTDIARSSGGGNQGCFGDSGANFLLQQDNNVTAWKPFCGSGGTVSGASSAWQGFQLTCNGASSSIYVNGTQTSSLSLGTNTIGSGSTFIIGGDGFGSSGEMSIVEAGAWAADKSGTYSALNSNIRGTANGWGF